MKRYCRNCYNPLPYKAKFCAHCGQRDTDGRVGMKSLMGRIWNNTFHLEGKFIRTSWQLFVPGMVSKEFFKGKQDRYPHPIRMFAIVMFLFLFLLNSILKNQDEETKGVFFSTDTAVKTEAGDTLVKERSFNLFEQMKYNAMLYEMQKDYERLPAALKTPQVQSAVDSLLNSFAGRYNLEHKALMDTVLEESLDSIGIGFSGVEISVLDIVRLEPNEIIQRYQLTGWFDKLMVRQGIKSIKTPDALAHAYIGSLTWTILILVALMSGVLALLYWRQRHYYVEHFIFLLHFHTGTMLFLMLAIIGYLIGIWDKGVIQGAAFLPAPAMYFALWRYYGQGWFKTFVKWVIYGFLYIFAFALSFVLGLLVVFALF
ncbi:MAG: DUF3667 domain-containing protein [Saprospiraceae bacterium]|nr:DUF3667 domain-containing protein [Saprospiraceae bacterium]